MPERTEAASTDQRIAVLADKDEIRELTARYCWHVSQGDVDGIVALFTEDGVFETKGAGMDSVARGRAGLDRMYRKGMASLRALPFIHNHIITADGDNATGICALEGRFTVDGQSITGAGHYRDTYRRENGAWRFAERRFFVDHMAPLKTGWAEAAAATPAIVNALKPES